MNAQIRYFLNFLSTPEISEQVFEMNQDTGDVGLKVPLSDLAGNTFHVSWRPLLDNTQVLYSMQALVNTNIS